MVFFSLCSALLASSPPSILSCTHGLMQIHPCQCWCDFLPPPLSVVWLVQSAKCGLSSTKPLSQGARRESGRLAGDNARCLRPARRPDGVFGLVSPVQTVPKPPVIRLC
ncbi:hypothetical protein CABS01_05536 [Colletotrichum abscissum]|uniref:uncharacterized protein n=1 Tax=Colletotrichum abscissum TaxID=1671311 RepID=UPI0027D67177|nr:uncharacterized protein CABS01_05536 [Colletotrichum abscissum]KAK1521031.1 hypothetical protein CABS01_05536 [Colletotrichum abscissum]